MSADGCLLVADKFLRAARFIVLSCGNVMKRGDSQQASLCCGTGAASASGTCGIDSSGQVNAKRHEDKEHLWQCQAQRVSHTRLPRVANCEAT